MVMAFLEGFSDSDVPAGRPEESLSRPGRKE
jgi:hypothetical protein